MILADKAKNPIGWLTKAQKVLGTASYSPRQWSQLFSSGAWILASTWSLCLRRWLEQLAWVLLHAGATKQAHKYIFGQSCAENGDSFFVWWVWWFKAKSRTRLCRLLAPLWSMYSLIGTLVWERVQKLCECWISVNGHPITKVTLRFSSFREDQTLLPGIRGQQAQVILVETVL